MVSSNTTAPSDVNPALDQAVSRFTFKIAAILFLRNALAGITFWWFCLGSGVLVFRVSTPIPRLWLVWGMLGLLPVLMQALLFTRRQIPAPGTVRALIDRESHCGGLLMASEHVPLGVWESKVPTLAEPQIQWNSRRSWVLFVIGLIFVVISYCVPVRFHTLAAGKTLDVNQEVSKLNGQIETLKNEEILESQKAQSLEEKLTKLQAESSAEDPVKTLEALDHLKDSLTKSAQEAAQNDVSATERMSREQTLSEGLSDGKKVDSNQLSEATDELSKMIKESLEGKGAESSQLGKNLPQDLKDALKSGKLSEQQMKELAKALKLSKQNLAKQLQNLKDAGLIDLKTLKMCEQAGQCDSQGLAEFLEKNKGKASVPDLLKEYGKGGVDRGRGDAPMSWTEGTSEKGAKFKEQTLPSNALSDLKNSQLVGLNTSAPKVEKNRLPANSGALNSSAVGGGSATTQTILPQHKNAVKQYFSRQ